MVRCPVCEGATVTVVLNSKPHASCGSCGATWIQEGSWQRSIRPGRVNLPVLPVSGNGGPSLGPPITLEHVEQDVIVLPDRARLPVRQTLPERPSEAIAT